MSDLEDDETEVSMLDLAAQHAELQQELEAAVARVLASQRYVHGPEVEAFEAELAAYCGTGYAVGCGSGSDALLLALMALDVGPGDEVLCPPFSFFATAGSVARLGARPVFADIDAASNNLCPAEAERVARSLTRLRAIVPVHLFGRVAELEELERLTRDLDVPLVEDAAQAIGASDPRGFRAGSRGAVGCFSFYPTKNLSALGDAGAVVCNDEGLAQLLRELRSHGESSRYRHERVGVNSRLDALQAALLRVKLPHVERWTRQRAALARVYDESFLEAGAHPASGDAPPGGLPIQIPSPVPPPARHVYHQYVIRVPAHERDPLQEHLRKSRIATGVYYPLGLHQQPCFTGGSTPPRLPVTEAAAGEVLALPIHAQLTPTRQRRVIEQVVRYFEAKR